MTDQTLPAREIERLRAIEEAAQRLKRQKEKGKTQGCRWDCGAMTNLLELVRAAEADSPRMQADIAASYLTLVYNPNETRIAIAPDLRQALARELTADIDDGPVDVSPEARELRELLCLEQDQDLLAVATSTIRRLFERLSEAREMGRRLSVLDYGLEMRDDEHKPA